MKRYYANLLGNWVDVTEADLISGRLPDTEPEELKFVDGEFTKICTDDGMYLVHYSQIQVFDDEL